MILERFFLFFFLQEIIVQELEVNYVTKLAYLEKQKILLEADHELLRNMKVEIDASNENISLGKEKLNKLKLLIAQQHYTLDLEEKRLRDLEKQVCNRIKSILKF